MDKADLIQECPSCGQQGWVMPDMKPQLRHEHDCPHKLNAYTHWRTLDEACKERKNE